MVCKYMYVFELNGKRTHCNIYAHSMENAKRIVTFHNELLGSKTCLLQRAYCYKAKKSLQRNSIELEQINEIRRKYYEI